MMGLVELQEDKDFGYWGVDFHSYASRAKELGMFLDRRPVHLSPFLDELLSVSRSGTLLAVIHIWRLGLPCRHKGLQQHDVCRPRMPIWGI